MKKKIIVTLLAVTAAYALHAQGAVQFTKQESSLDAPKILNVGNPVLKSCLTFQAEGGVTGGCYKADKTAGQKGTLMILIAKNSWLNVQNASSELKFQIALKGKGSIRLSFLCYNKKKRYFTQFDKRFVKQDTAGKWKTYSFTYTPSPKNTQYLSNIAFMMPVLMVDGGSFLLDDWKGEVEAPSTQIQLED